MNILMHLIKEPQQEVTSLCDQTLTKMKQSAFLIKQDFQINEKCYDGDKTLKQEPNDFTTTEEAVFTCDGTSTVSVETLNVGCKDWKITYSRFLKTLNVSSAGMQQNVKQIYDFIWKEIMVQKSFDVSTGFILQNLG